ncbi:hypothetical protein OIO90_004461 [Microbotryomycetes sp. JL221]|nr:hypothetical protein OIO90_004461 [Microbotryomycetes sp. JL221]
MNASSPATPARRVQKQQPQGHNTLQQFPQPLVSIAWRRHSFSTANQIKPGLNLFPVKSSIKSKAAALKAADKLQVKLPRQRLSSNVVGNVDSLSSSLAKMTVSTPTSAPQPPNNSPIQQKTLYQSETASTAPAAAEQDSKSMSAPSALAPAFEPRCMSLVAPIHYDSYNIPFVNNSLGIHIDGNAYLMSPCNGDPFQLLPPTVKTLPRSSSEERGSSNVQSSPDNYVHHLNLHHHNYLPADYYPINKHGIFQPQHPPSVASLPAPHPNDLLSPPWSPPSSIMPFPSTYLGCYPCSDFYSQTVAPMYPSTPPSPGDNSNAFQRSSLGHPPQLDPDQYRALRMSALGIETALPTYHGSVHLSPPRGLSIGPSVAQQLEDGAVMRRTGLTKFFDLQKGFGFIVDDNVAEIFNRDTILMKSGFRCLHTDEPVEYDLVKASNGGYQALNVSGANGAKLRGLSSAESQRLAALGSDRKTRGGIVQSESDVTCTPTTPALTPSKSAKQLPRSIVVSLPTPSSSRAGSNPPTPNRV